MSDGRTLITCAVHQSINQSINQSGVDPVLGFMLSSILLGGLSIFTKYSLVIVIMHKIIMPIASDECHPGVHLDRILGLSGF
jgi:hypothetical protein